MGKASSSKKVARAAKAGGGPSRRQGNTSWSFYGTLAGITVVGMVLLGVSLNSVKADTTPPTLNDHWHAAYGIYVCDKYVEPINGEGLPDITGIHAHADGLIHIHPFTSAVTGKRATLDKFEESVNFTITEKEMKLPDDRGDYKNGGTCTVDGKKKTAKVKVFTYTRNSDSGAQKLDKAEQLLGDPGDIRLYQGQILAFAFVPDGVTPPVPPSEPALAAPSDLATTPAPSPSTTPAPSTTASGATATTAAGATASTASGAPSTTAASATTGPTTTASATTGPTTTAA